jgi:hypothetical protein
VQIPFPKNDEQYDATLADAFTSGDTGFANRLFATNEKEKRPFPFLFRFNRRSCFWK